MKQEDFFKRFTYNVRNDKVGGGAFGSVYKAFDNILNRDIAIKVSEVKIKGGKEFSLKDEFDAIKNLDPHPNIANYEKLYTFDMPNGIFDYAIMQFYKDGNLSQLIKKEKLSSIQKDQISSDLLQGIIHLHKNKVVHRDLKPSNILVLKHAERIIPIITDFGLSKQTNLDAKTRFTNSFAGGTLQYSSPEQLKGQILRLNTDLWAYGVIVYEIFTQKRLFDFNYESGLSAEAEKEIYEQILNEDLSKKLSQLPQKWQEILNICLVREASKRAKSAEELQSFVKEDNIPKAKFADDSNNNETIVDIGDNHKKNVIKPIPNKEEEKHKSEKNKQDELAWKRVELLNELDIYLDFIKNNPNNIFLNNAIDRVNKLKEIAKAKETNLWTAAKKQNTINAYKNYLKEYKNGNYSSEAKQEIDVLEETEFWQKVKQENSVKSLKLYLDKYPKGKFINEAKQDLFNIIDKTEWKKAQQTNTINAYNTYISNTNNKGEYVNKAKELIFEIKDYNLWKDCEKFDTKTQYEKYINELGDKAKNIAKAKEKIRFFKHEEAWQKILIDSSEYNLKSYIRDYPNGKKIEQAKVKLEAIYEEQAWDKCSYKTDFENYIKKYPEGKFVEEAQKKIIKITEQEKQKEETYWAGVVKENLRYRYENYLKNYPDGFYKTNAEKAIKEIKQKATKKTRKVLFKITAMLVTVFVIYIVIPTEKDYWNIAKDADTIEAYEKYLDKYPTGVWRDDAIYDIYDIIDNNPSIKLYEETLDKYPNEGAEEKLNKLIYAEKENEFNQLTVEANNLYKEAKSTYNSSDFSRISKAVSLFKQAKAKYYKAMSDYDINDGYAQSYISDINKLIKYTYIKDQEHDRSLSHSQSTKAIYNKRINKLKEAL